MKKFLLFSVIFTFLAGLGWGQAEFRWVGGVSGDVWDEPLNWEVINANGVTDPAYPGDDDRFNDIVTIEGNDTVSVSSSITLGTLIIKNNTVGTELQINNQLKVTNLTLEGTLSITGTPGILSIENITLNADGEATGSIEMNGSAVLVPSYPGALEINSAAGNIGNINAGNRPVEINIADNAGIIINIGNIISDGNITIDAGDDNNVTIGKIFSGEDVSISAGTGSSVTVDNIAAAGTVSVSGAVTNNNSSNIYEWIGTTDTVWTDNDNWHTKISPGAGDSAFTIIIKNPSAYYPVFSGATLLLCHTLTIETGASLDMDVNDLSVNTLDNNGNLILAGSGTQNVGITSITNNELVTYNTAGGEHFAGLTEFNNLIIEDGDRNVAENIKVGGNFRLESGLLEAAAVTVTGTSFLAADITTTGIQTYTGDVTLGGTGTRTLEGTTIILGTIIGSGRSLTIDGNGEFTGGSGINELTVNGASIIYTDISSTGNQTYNGTVTLDGNIELTGSTVTLGNITGNARSLTITGSGVLNGGNGINDLTVTGTATLNSDITSTGEQKYDGVVTLAGSGTRTLNGSAVTFGGSITGAGLSLTVTGNVVLNGGSGINNLSVTGTADINADITTTGNQTYNETVTLGGTGTRTLEGTTVTLGDIAGNSHSLAITGNGVLHGGSGINVLTVTGTTTLNEDITTTGNQTYTGMVTLGKDIELTGLTVTFGTITGNTHSLIITGNGVLNGGSGIDELSVSGTATINANITSTGDQTYNEAVILSGDVNFTSDAGSNIWFNSTINGTAPAKKITITNANVKFDGTVGSLTTTYIESVTVIAGTTDINADITTTGVQNYGSGTVTLIGTRTLTSTGTAGNITAADMTGMDITINAGGNISLLGITGSAVILNAGYPEHTVFGTPGTVTLTDITVTNLTIWCESVDSPPGVSSGGTKEVTGDIKLYTDYKTINETDFLTYFTSIGGNTVNELRIKNVEFGPIQLHSNFDFYNSTVQSTWDNPINISGHSHVYITGTITALGDLEISTETGNIIFEIDSYNSDIFKVDLKTEGGQIIQNNGTINVDNKIAFNVKGIIIQNGGKIITDELDITTDNAVTLAKDNEITKLTIVSSGTTDVTLNNNTNIEISGISGANDVYLTVNGDIDISGRINSTKTVSLTANGDIDLSGGINASSITIEAGSITGNGTAVSAGDISFINSIAGSNSVSLAGFNAGGTIFVSTNAKDIVYYSSVPPATPPSGGTWTTPLFVEANSVYGGNVELKTNGASCNIYLVDVVDSSGKTLTADCSVGTGINGFIEFFATNINKKSYEYSGSNDNHLNLLPGAGGVRINDAIVDFTKNFKINNIELTLYGSTGSGIKAANINLDKVTATNSQDLTLEAAEDIIVNENAGTSVSPLGNLFITGGNITFNNTINTAGNIIMEASGDIKLLRNVEADGVTLKTDGNINVIGAINANNAVTLDSGENTTNGGKITAYQLIAKAKGNVTVYEVEINSLNTGNEGLNAAIYIKADNFFVTGTSSPPTTYPIVPGGQGSQWGQLCLELIVPWSGPYDVVDGPQDMDPDNLTLICFRWHQHLPPVIVNGKILYSFTEDSSGNGRLDRIRVQTNVELYGDFSDFDVSVEEYEIDRTQGVNGFAFVSDVTLNKPFDNDSFYIYLKENSENDGEKTPLWSVIKNTSLINKTGSIVGDRAVDIDIKPYDTIPPRIVYTLTLPGHLQTYMQVSEHVVSSSGADISASFGGNLSVQSVNKVNPSGFGYLFILSGNLLKIEDLANNIDSPTLGNGYFLTDAVDLGQKAEDKSEVDPDAKPPKYPLDWSYSKYVRVSSNGNVEDETGPIVKPLTDILIPPNKLLTAGLTSNPRRVTDILVSMAPADTNSDNYFTWPVWARFKKSLNAPYTGGNDVFWGQQPTDTGIIWQFDGSSFLETNFIDTNEGLEIQARTNNNLTEAPVLFWTTSDVPAEYRNPKEATDAKKTGGLWLPNVITNPLYNYVNYVPMSYGINGKSADSSSAKLFNYTIGADSLIVNSGDKFEFIFRLSDASDMFIARLDIPQGAAIPANWYTLIRPFVFDIQNIRRQRGGVSVLNNVINSNNRETAFIRYHLTRPGRVTVQIYTLDGTLVKSIRRNEQRAAGEWTDSWDGTNNGGRAVARGMYFVRVVGPDIDEIRKIMVVK